MTRPSSADAHGVDAQSGTGTQSGADARPGKVWFIGAGPGDPELITVKGQRLIRQADLVVYAGSLVPRAVVADAGCESASGRCRVVDSSPLHLDETHALCLDCARGGGLVARVHTGDPSLYGAVQEQARLLQRDGIAYEIVPGVSAAFAAAAAAGLALTVPERTQTVILTRLPGRTPMPEKERLRVLAEHGCTLAVYLSAQHVPLMQEELSALPPDTPVVCAHKVGWPGEAIVHTTVAAMADAVREHAFDSQTLFLVLPGERSGAPHTASRLYAPDFSHACRNGS